MKWRWKKAYGERDMCNVGPGFFVFYQLGWNGDIEAAEAVLHRTRPRLKHERKTMVMFFLKKVFFLVWCLWLSRDNR